MPAVGTTDTTVGDVIHETQSQLLSTYRWERNKLAGNIGTTDTTLTFSYELRGVNRGTYLSNGTEVMYVWSADQTAKQATVERAVLGSTAQAHTTSDTIDVNSPFPDYLISNFLKAEIRSWPSDVFSVDYIDVDASSTYISQGINLPITRDFHFILDVRHVEDRTGYSKNWPEIQHFEIIRNAPTSDFASGTGIILRESVPTGKVRIKYAQAFDLSDWSSSTQLGTIGLASQQYDIPALGAMWRLVGPRENQRVNLQNQPVPRDAQEVDGGSYLRAASVYKQLRDQRLAEEAARLRAKYPVRHT